MESEKRGYEKMIEKAAELGRKYEAQYFGCSQGALAAVMEAFGLGGPDLLRASNPFAGGVVRRGNVCGALSGGLMMIGYLTGRDDLQMPDQYQRGMGYADRLCRMFEGKYGSLICREIQQKKFGRTFDLQKEEDREALHEILEKDPDACQAVTADAARMTAELVAEILREGPPFARMLAGRPLAE
jgi:C_GCAxxG_C_C family probable redox protein